MVYLHDDVLDNGVTIVDTNCDRLDICSQEPANYTEASSTYTLGNKTGITVSTPANGTGGGRAVTISAITDGSVTGTGTATHFAISDVSGTQLYAAQSLSSSQAVTSGNTFTLTAFEVRIPDAA